jgi:hypothetical protein
MVENNEDIYKIIQKYIWTTSDEYFSRKFKLSNVYEIKRNEDNFKNLGNKKLLWYSARFKNHTNVLSKGLKPLNIEELPKCAYLFGKGIPFYDSISSISFIVEANEKFLIIYLCEVSLGNVLEMVTSDFLAHQLPDTYSSTKACGKVCPSKFINYKDIEIPLGPIIKNMALNVILIKLDLLKLQSIYCVQT